MTDKRVKDSRTNKSRAKDNSNGECDEVNSCDNGDSLDGDYDDSSLAWACPGAVNSEIVRLVSNQNM